MDQQTTPSDLRLSSFHSPGLQEFNLTIQGGTCCTLSGPSGSGKTRLLRAISDLDPHQGSAILGNLERETASPTVWRQQVAYLAAESHWWAPIVEAHFRDPDTTLLSALKLPGEALSWEVSRLSSGERQRLALLRLLSIGPKFLLLDEPTANLDNESAQAVEQLLSTLLKEQGIGMLWVSHDPAQCKRVGQQHLAIEDSKLVQRPWT